ncbi:uncharacterized protein LOC114527808 [Dendronephthya gigantea]|uniref:uncharacterized protein LOC114527808 n=1 Tax=Dendronephthya gigantea TaxID=151771 RepID=UPI00106A40A0|nr:uncharacterized protein LOC114527808 [Dendronephthya gigantea]
MSYSSKTSTETITLAFYADDPSGASIKSFSGNLFGHYKGTATIPINDGYWHHVGFTWSGVTGQWMLLIDGVLWAHRNTLKGRKIQSGGILNIGKITHKEVNCTLVGSISRVNLWSQAKNGSEIELIAKSPGSREGDLIAWFTAKDNIVSRQRIIRPSNASFSGDGLNYEMTLPLSNEVNYPGPSKPMKFLSTCLWVKNGGNAQFFAYSASNTFSLRYTSLKELAFTLNSLSEGTAVTCDGWHFLCMKWNGEKGKASLYYDGYQSGNSFEDAKLVTELPAGRNFIFGSSGDSATLTQLNIWWIDSLYTRA